MVVLAAAAVVMVVVVVVVVVVLKKKNNFLQLYCPNGISPVGNSGCLPRGKPATQPTVHAGCFSVSIVHRTLTWTSGFSTCTQLFMHAIAQGGARTHVRESALKVDSGRKIPCRTGESNLRQQRASPILYQLSYIPTHSRSSSSSNSSGSSNSSSSGNRKKRKLCTLLCAKTSLGHTDQCRKNINTVEVHTFQQQIFSSFFFCADIRFFSCSFLSYSAVLIFV